MGVYEGLTKKEAMHQYPDLWARQCTQRLGDAPTGGETIDQVLSRISNALEQLKKTYPSQTVLLVCHGLISRAINKLCLNLSFAEMQQFLLDNCEIATYRL